ncbi:hypothetical protein [Sulfurimonas autotrophica]|uniref:Integral membrane protein n=1 Tax=Sulfurimonas autotrophica (strain ATCC BAA-671 / DSM 16294 / JCM 11897 / OK10) TaxID=563040 RepID=E0UTB1_SULAO|nr:hypothetical protein [Sulfurimonas autotrophica]ADN08214.1 hypothetical protein Saut_0165 [Sulfurimonas autotrophica DSM 16294]
MLEYLNYGGLGIFVFIAIIMIIMGHMEKRTPVGSYIFLLTSISAFLFMANNEYTTALQNINDFKNQNATLKCVSGGGLYTSADTYRVSLNDGWSLDKNYFIKESFMVDADKCEKFR